MTSALHFMAHIGKQVTDRGLIEEDMRPWLQLQAQKAQVLCCGVA